MRFKRYRKYRNSTKVIRMKFQSFMDISTDVDSMKIITVSAGGKNVLQRLPGFFSAYKYYKLGNVSVKLVPASTLPVDPTGLAYGVDQKVDPRDQLSPGLCRITNGEDIFENISGLSATEQENIYNSMMLDPRWFKWMLQSGVKRHGSPRYWQIGQLHQDKWPGAVTNIPFIDSEDGVVDTATILQGATATGLNNYGAGYSSALGLFQTGHRGVLGWMPTDGLQTTVNLAGDGTVSTPFLASPPEVEMFKIILPKAFKTRYYYRMFISETVYFKEPIVQSAMPMRPLDVFHVSYLPGARVPSFPLDNTPSDSETGGNYGDY